MKIGGGHTTLWSKSDALEKASEPYGYGSLSMTFRYGATNSRKAESNLRGINQRAMAKIAVCGA